MKKNKTAVIISASAIVVFAFTACFWHDNTTVFEASVLLLSFALGAFCYSLLYRIYKW